MKLPAQYEWLNKIGTLPKMVEFGLSLLGTQEVIGKGSNKTILSWRDTLNQNGVIVEGYSDDSIPWCGLFIAYLTFMRRRLSNEVVSNPLWARNWVNYGEKSPEASLGDILVFVRNGGGHVGIYIGEDSTTYHVLGGNQSDNVTITRIAKNRCIAVRRPKYNTKPDSVKPYKLKSGGTISTNEA